MNRRTLGGLVLVLLVMTTMWAPASAAPDGGGRSGDDTGPVCGPNSIPDESGNYVPCWPEDQCRAVTKGTGCPIDEEGFDPESRDAGAMGEIVCTGDEGMGAMITCIGPVPEEPDLEETQRITRTVEVACDAVPPPPDWELAGLPAQTINHNPLKRGLTGLETWLWSTGEHAHYWTQSAFGEQGLDFYGNVGELQPDGSVVWGEEEVLLAEQRWWCMRQAGFFARVVAWDWWMHGPSHRHDGSVNHNPQTLTASSDRPGATPDSDGDGSEASARIMMEWKGEWVIGLDTTWQADWGGTHVQTNPEVDYQVVEVRSELRPSP